MTSSWNHRVPSAPTDSPAVEALSSKTQKCILNYFHFVLSIRHSETIITLKTPNWKSREVEDGQTMNANGRPDGIERSAHISMLFPTQTDTFLKLQSAISSLV